MFSDPKVKLKLVLSGIAAAIVLSALSPFLISREIFQGVFLAFDFLTVAYLWKQFNNLRVVINKKELEDENISKLEKEVNRIIRSK